MKCPSANILRHLENMDALARSRQEIGSLIRVEFLPLADKTAVSRNSYFWVTSSFNFAITSEALNAALLENAD